MTYQIHGCFVEMSSAMQTARVRRLEIRDGEKLIQSAVEAEFQTKVVDGVTISAQEQAHLWARALPEIVELPADEPTEVDEDK